MSTFTCPVAYDTPATLPLERGLGNRLFRYFASRKRYIAVFYLSNGTFVQDTPNGFAPDGTTVANTNCDIPYPYDFNNPSGPYSTSYYVDYTVNPPVSTVVTVSHNPYIVKLYQGASTVTAEEVALLTAAGYGACIS